MKTTPPNRRDVLKTMAGALILPMHGAISADNAFQISHISAHTVRITVGPSAASPKSDGSLLELRPLKAGTLKVSAGPDPDPLSFTVRRANDEPVLQLKVDAATGALMFPTGAAPLLALGEGGPQFDRRGSTDRMRSGQGGYQLRTHGGRVPMQWLISAGGGWAMFIHSPYGTFDFSGAESKFQPANGLSERPLDVFVVASQDPTTIMSEYALLTGHPELPPLWSFGYQQSHRTLTSREEILAEAKTFREKKLPCDTMIYLGTGFCPSGWNTNNGEFDFNKKVFPDPKAMFDELHAEHFKVALHAVIKSRSMSGTVKDACDPSRPVEEQPSCYWKVHQPVYALGVDGWWPDEGDPMNAPSRLARNRMYWEAPQLDRPNERPFALHRNGAPGMQRYGAFLWSGDVYSTWETLKVHLPVAVNTGLSGVPYWGTDIGGFVPTPEFTAELYLRWFQFAAFCPLFRSHGRQWKLRLPWGWNTGELGPMEIANYNGSGLPDPSQLHDERVEPICRKYLELRYRLMPYLYSAVRESTVTGMPVMRAMWLHYPDDAVAVARGDQYLWGRDMLVAPVVEKDAASRKLYLPQGTWYDYWTGEKVAGGQEITRAVDLSTTPVYVRAGAIIPHDPVRQYTGEPVAEPMEIRVHPGANGTFLLYEYDGRSFNYRHGEWMGVEMAWSDARKTLSLALAKGSRMLPPAKRDLVVRMGESTRKAVFTGRPLEVKF